MSMDAKSHFMNALSWLQENYSRFRFFTERDMVWTVQNRLIEQIADDGRLDYQVYNDYPMLPGKHRSLSTDIAIVNSITKVVEVAVEFKYEPSHARSDILKDKLPVVIWKEVIKDIERVHEYVDSGKAVNGISLLVDEGGYFQKRDIPLNSYWEKWDNHTSVLVSRA